MEVKHLTEEGKLQKWQTEFKKGFSKPLILLTLAEEQSYPYRLTRKISEKTKGQIIIAGSNIYPILKNQEDEGLIQGIKDEKTGRKLYHLTEEGQEFLKLLKSSMKEFCENILAVVDDQRRV